MNSLSRLPTVDIVIPAKNEADHIILCLNSIRKLDYDHNKVTIYVIDNDSNDNTSNLAMACGATVVQKSGGTIASVRNFGATHGKGEIIAFLDADTVVESNWLAEGVRILKDDLVSAVGFVLAEPSLKHTWVEKMWFLLSTTYKHRGTHEVKWLSSFNFIVKRSFFLQVRGFDPDLRTCEDADIGYRLSKVSKCILSDKSSVKHLGSVKTLRQFIMKEFWRGKDNFTSFMSTGSIYSLQSTFAPPLYLLLIFASITLAFLNSQLIGISVGLIFLPPLLMVLFKARHVPVRFYSGLWTLSFFYLLSRGTAFLFSKPRPGWSQNLVRRLKNFF